MSKDTARLGRLGVLAPAALSATMGASVLAVPAASAIVSTLLKELSKAFMLKRWFHGMMSAKAAELLLMEKGKNGSYLVRESQAHPGEFVLSVRVRDRVSHVMIRRQHNKYDIGSGEQFDELAGLIEHVRAFPLTASSGDVLRLLQPVAGGLRARHIPRKGSEDSQKPGHKNECDREFLSMKMLEERHVFTTIEGNRPENATKNRYRNIVPYDQTRVVLRRRSGSAGYINANYVRAVRLADSYSSVQSSIESLNSIQSFILGDELAKTPSMSKSLSDEALTEDKCSIKSDLTNGNLCHGAAKDKFYIATQGCLSNTKDDFWQMIWQDNVRIIAMITSEVEKGKKKCERYWPLSGERERYGDIVVKSISETCQENYVVREFDVCDDKDHCKTIFQYQFTAWADHGTPSEPDGVLSFVEEINQRMFQLIEDKNPPEQNVLCVHCSAGVGRTGTFIALDILLDKIKLSGLSCTIDVYNTVKLLRAQRSGMVQNKAQYRFIYRALQTYMENNKIQLKRKVFKAEA